MDSVEVHKLLLEINTKVVRVTVRSDADQLIDHCSDIGQILRFLDEETHDVIAEQMVEKFWRLTLRWYYFSYDSQHEPFQSSNDELFQIANMRISVLELFGDMYGEGLELEARTICLALKKACRDFLKLAGKVPKSPAKPSAPKTPQGPIRLVVSN